MTWPRPYKQTDRRPTKSYRLSPAVAAFLLSLLWSLAPAEASGADVTLSSSQKSLLARLISAGERARWGEVDQGSDDLESRLLRKLMRWYALVYRSNAPLDFETYQQFLDENGDWPKSLTLRLRAEQAIDGGTLTASVLNFFADQKPVSQEGRIRYADALRRHGRLDEARPYLRDAWRTGRFSVYQEREFLDRYGASLTPDDHRERVQELLWRGSFTEAERMIARVDGPTAALARARLALQRSTPGVDYLIDAVPEDRLSDDGLVFDRVQWRRRKGRALDAQSLLRQTPPMISEPSSWWRERHIHLRQRIEEEDWQGAYEIVADHRQTSGLGLAEAEWYAGWLALRFLDRPQEALRRFEGLWEKVRTPISRARVAYWAGRAAEALDDGPNAETWLRRAAGYDTAFYGQRAIERLKLDQPRLGERPIEARLWSDAFSGSELVRIVRLLGQIGDRTLLPIFLRQVIDLAIEAGEVGHAVALAAEVGRPDLMILASQQLALRGEILEVASHPIPDVPAMLNPEAFTVEPALMLAVARQESRFEPTVMSPAGARGLMQLMPATAEAIARRQGIPYDPTRLLSDANYNARLAGHYLGSLLRRFDGELILAIAGYNAGPGRSIEWSRRHGDPRGMSEDERIDWIERIPFGETRNYVQRVLEGFWVYKRRAGAGAFTTVPLAEDPGPLVPPPRPRLKPLSQS
ncbi:MAG: transglycosylase SLT domain-containing protein [Geminicoccaceae bacterium]